MNAPAGNQVSSLAAGTVVTLTRSFTQSDFDRFAALSGDDNPIHVDPEFAARSRFGRPVCHGMLLYSTLSAALNDAFGPGRHHLEQELMFAAPTYAGDELLIRLELEEDAAADGPLTVASTMTLPDGATACQGRTRLSAPAAPPMADERSPAEPPSQPDAAGPSAHKGLRLGQSASLIRTFTPADLVEYRALAGDANPLHAPADDGTPAHLPGGLLGGLISTLLGTQLPGRGTNWLKQRLHFVAPCFAGDEVTASVEVVRLRPEKDLVNLRSLCTVAGRVVCTGESLVLVKDLVDG